MGTTVIVTGFKSSPISHSSVPSENIHPCWAAKKPAPPINYQCPAQKILSGHIRSTATPTLVPCGLTLCDICERQRAGMLKTQQVLSATPLKTPIAHPKEHTHPLNAHMHPAPAQQCGCMENMPKHIFNRLFKKNLNWRKKTKHTKHFLSSHYYFLVPGEQFFQCNQNLIIAVSSTQTLTSHVSADSCSYQQEKRNFVCICLNLWP